MLEALNIKKGLVAILIDQHAGQHGTMIPFLGKEANTVRTVAGIVKKTQCAVLPTYSILQKDGTYDVFISEAPMLDLTGKSDEQAIEAYQIQHNDIISEWIRKYPEHYFGWFHKRYRGIISYK
jgi:lauroyl/myristoyl acyltransferase